MSNNRKNKIGPDFLKNFTKYVENRCIVIENATALKADILNSVNTINKTVNTLIQELNVKISDRQLPYITLTIKYSSDLDRHDRFFVHGNDTTDLFEKEVMNNTECIGVDISHMVDILIAGGYKDVIISSWGCDAEIVVAQEYFECAIVDVLLDIVMFNSYSFMRKLPLTEKHDFSFKKYQYYKANSLNCFYNCKTSKELYYSFAFSARKTEIEFNVDEYIDLWNRFMYDNYRCCTHKEIPITQQLKNHVDYGELASSIAKKFNRKPQGAYLLMRTNKDRTDSLRLFICTVFGIKEYEKGKIKIVPIEQFEEYKPLFENLDVSAFKIVKL